MIRSGVNKMSRRLNDLTGKNFGEWCVLRRGANDKHKHSMWVCQCSCGTVCQIIGDNLVSGHSKSCGCQNSRRLIRPYEALYNILHRNAKQRRIHVGLSYEHFLRFAQILFCHYCGAEVKWTKHNTAKNGVSYNLDRKDPSKGYVKENLVVCCGLCNEIKGRHLTYDQMLQKGGNSASRKTTA